MKDRAPYIAVRTVADIREEPTLIDGIGRRESQLLLGEIFDVESREGRFFKGRSRNDGYKGYVHFADIMPAHGKATHFVDNPLTIIHTAPTIKRRGVMSASFMSKLEIEPDSLTGEFVRACGLGWVPVSHIKPLSSLKVRIDHVDQALRLMAAPYRYGGRSALGIDCSGLVQLSLTRSGFGRIPRDADMQEKSARLGPKVNSQSLQRGDIVFFPHHVGIMLDHKNILSATEKFSGVVIEKISDMVKRQGAITTVRRPAPL